MAKPRKTSSKGPSEMLKDFMKKPSKARRSLLLDVDQTVRDLIDEYLTSYTEGRTNKTMQEFYTEFLKLQLKVSFSKDTLRRYCIKYKPTLWKAYKEKRNVSR